MISGGPRITTRGLNSLIYPLSVKSYRPDNNILNPRTWIIGTNGSQTGFTRYGDNDENEIILDTDPFGNKSAIWEAIPNGSNNPDGGWDSSTFSPDINKMYRFSVWVKKNKSSDGRFYLGALGYGSVDGLYNRSNGSNNTNPYFFSGETNPAGILDTWALIIGHLWPEGSGAGDNHSDTGKYRIADGKFSSTGNDLVFRSETETTLHRSYLFSSLDTTIRQYFVYPRVDIVDGTEPTINQLLNNDINSIYIKDILNNNNVTILNGTTINNDSFVVLDGTNDFIETPEITLNKNSSSISAWLYIDDFATGKTSTGRVFIRNSSTNSYSLISFFEGGYSFETNTNSDPHEIASRTTGNVTNSNITAGSWFHFCLVFDSENFYGYINGESAGSGAITDDLTFDQIGSASGFSDLYPGYYKGRIGNVLLYDVSLTATEVLANYNSTKSRFTL